MENTNVKVTINEKYNMIISMLEKNGFNIEFEDSTNAIDFLRDRQEKAVRKGSPSKADLAKREANENIKNRIVDALKGKNPMSVSNIVKLSELADLGLSVPKASAMLTQLLGNGSVTRVLEKKTPLYSVQ